jgi:hypothetical protein
MSCLNEPIRGYIDAWTASSQYIPIIGRGLKRSLNGDNNVVMDLIPADMVTNITLAAAWNTALNKYPFVPVFNISSGMTNPITSKEVLSQLIPENCRKYPFGILKFYYTSF